MTEEKKPEQQYVIISPEQLAALQANINPPVSIPRAPPAPQEPPDKSPDWIYEKQKRHKGGIFNRYPIVAILLETRMGSGTYACFDRIGRFKKKLGLGFEYKLKYKKKRLPTAQFENIIESNKGRVIIISHPEEDVFLPVQIEGTNISAKETAWKEIFMNNVERAHTLLMRRGFIERYMPLILLMTMGMLMIIMFWVARMDIQAVYEQFQQAIGGATAALEPVNIQTIGG